MVSLLSPTSSLSAFLTSLEYPPSTSTIILNCVTRYSGYLCSSSQRNGPYFVAFSASFSSLFSTQGQVISITDTTSHQCDPGSILRSGASCGLSLLVLFPAPRGFSPGTPVFPSPQKPTFISPTRPHKLPALNCIPCINKVSLHLPFSYYYYHLFCVKQRCVMQILVGQP